MTAMNRSDKIRALLADGLSTNEIAKRVKCTTALVYNVRSKQKAEILAGKKKADKYLAKPTREEKALVRAQLTEGFALLDTLKSGGEDKSASDPINPDYYWDGNIETIDFIEAKDLNFRLANVVKYVSRAGKKPGAMKITDLQKAAWYLQREIDRSEVQAAK
jgi:hypothetical protein